MPANWQRFCVSLHCPSDSPLEIRDPSISSVSLVIRGGRNYCFKDLIQLLLLLFVLRVCEYISTLEHSHFSDGASQPSLTITQSQQAPGGLHPDSEPRESPQAVTPEQETTLSSNPVIQPVSIQELIKESSKGRPFDFRGGSLLCGTSAAKAVLTLSTQADR